MFGRVCFRMLAVAKRPSAAMVVRSTSARLSASATSARVQPAMVSVTSIRPFSSSESADVNHDARVRRLLYRCKQRGLRELDLLMGTWADENLDSLSPSDLDDFEKLCEHQESPHIMKWLTGQMEIPPEFDTAVLKSLIEYTHSGSKSWAPKNE